MPASITNCITSPTIKTLIPWPPNHSFGGMIQTPFCFIFQGLIMLSIKSFSYTNQMIKGIVLLLNLVILVKGFYNEYYYIGLLFSIPVTCILFRRLRHQHDNNDGRGTGKHSYLYQRQNFKKTHP